MTYRRFALLVLAATTILTFDVAPAEAGLGHQLLSLFGRGTIRTPLPTPRSAVLDFGDPGVKRVVLIILENGSPEDAKGQPFMMRRASEGMLLNQYFAVAHPSQPNYIALISGSVADTNGDRRVLLHRDHLGRHLTNRWKVYAEDYPTPANPALCSSTRQDGAYVQRHVPFLSFDDVDCRAVVRLNSDATTRRVSSRLPAPRDVSSVTQALRDDITGGTLPSFVMIIPNLTDDGHAPSNMVNANDWLTRYIEPLLHDNTFTDGTVFILTFDEDDHEDADHPNRVYTVLWGDHVHQGSDNAVYDHEDLYLTIAALLHISPLPSTDESDSRPIGGIWK
jgi:phosphoesterase family protein